MNESGISIVFNKTTYMRSLVVLSITIVDHHPLRQGAVRGDTRLVLKAIQIFMIVKFFSTIFGTRHSLFIKDTHLLQVFSLAANLNFLPRDET